MNFQDLTPALSVALVPPHHQRGKGTEDRRGDGTGREAALIVGRLAELMQENRGQANPEAQPALDDEPLHAIVDRLPPLARLPIVESMMSATMAFGSVKSAEIAGPASAITSTACQIGASGTGR